MFCKVKMGQRATGQRGASDVWKSIFWNEICLWITSGTVAAQAPHDTI